MRFICHQPPGRFGVGLPLLCAVTVWLAGSFASQTTHAARPMIVDDACIIDAKSCQLETWMKNNRDSAEYWALPARNFTGNLELTLGGCSRLEL